MNDKENDEIRRELARYPRGDLERNTFRACLNARMQHGEPAERAVRGALADVERSPEQ
jgi:ADP-dependent phosphofructokinase/glucokinase